jgi:hypothetical protein
VAGLASLVGPAVAASLWIAGLAFVAVAALAAAVRSARGTSGPHVPWLG